jgi:hypothetical protein
MTLCQLIQSHWCFQGACCHHLHGLWNPRTFLSLENVGIYQLTLILLMWRIGWAPNNASKWQMRFDSVFKGLTEHPIPKAMTLKIFSTLVGSVCWTSASSISSNNTQIYDLILWDLQVNHRLVVLSYILTLQGKLKDSTLKQFMTIYKTVPA